MGAGIEYDHNDSHYELHHPLALMSINESKDIVPHLPAEETKWDFSEQFQCRLRGVKQPEHGNKKRNRMERRNENFKRESDHQFHGKTYADKYHIDREL